MWTLRRPSLKGPALHVAVTATSSSCRYTRRGRRGAGRSRGPDGRSSVRHDTHRLARRAGRDPFDRARRPCCRTPDERARRRSAARNRTSPTRPSSFAGRTARGDRRVVRPGSRPAAPPRARRRSGLAGGTQPGLLPRAWRRGVRSLLEQIPDGGARARPATPRSSSDGVGLTGHEVEPMRECEGLLDHVARRRPTSRSEELRLPGSTAR